MRTLGNKSRLGLLALGGVAIMIGIGALVQSPAQAARPAPDCGPTRQWTCALPGCPSCYVVLFEGTICEKKQFEKKTGRVCSPG